MRLSFGWDYTNLGWEKVKLNHSFRKALFELKSFHYLWDFGLIKISVFAVRLIIYDALSSSFNFFVIRNPCLFSLEYTLWRISDLISFAFIIFQTWMGPSKTSKYPRRKLWNLWKVYNNFCSQFSFMRSFNDSVLSSNIIFLFADLSDLFYVPKQNTLHSGGCQNFVMANLTLKKSFS